MQITILQPFPRIRAETDLQTSFHVRKTAKAIVMQGCSQHWPRKMVELGGRQQ